MNQYSNTLDASEPTDGKEPTSINNSPVKPLSFPKQNLDSHNSNINLRASNSDLNNKEFNSSSDTCISESESPRPTNENKSNTNNNSFDRNFSFDDSDQINKTIQTKIKLEDEEFSFIAQTPMTSTIDLNNPSKEDEATSNYNNSSPNKSIMKKTDSSSPSRKNVVFTNSTPEIHHYPANKSNITTISNEESIDQLPHEWNELPKESSQSSDEDNQTPPVPPVHRTDTFSSLLQDDNKDDMDRDTLNELKLKHQNFSNLSLNEKLDVFLSNKHMKTEELDDHLTNLDNAVKNKTGTNIHVLSLDLKRQEQNEVENPLNSLMKSSEVRLRSAGSSQSSLQSLVDNNRYLESNGRQFIPNKGIELNDGIKGFSNHMVEALIPTDNNEIEREGEEDEEEEVGLMMKTPSNSRINELKQSEMNDSENEEFHDSFDTNTEQSIMNLLKSASNSDLNKPNFQFQLGSVLIKQEDEKEDEEEKEEKAECNVFVKDEPKDSGGNEDMLFSDDEQHQLTKSEFIRDDGLKKESDINYHEYEATSKIESVSGYGRTHKDIRLIKSDVNNTQGGKENELNNDNIPKVTDETSIDDTSEVTESVNKFSIRDHIDSDWKFEDSNDGDREDNDDYTNNELTTVNDDRLENNNKGTGMYSNTKGESLLNVNLSPNISVNSQEFKDASDHFIGKTLAPRSVDEAIDATHPPVPLKDLSQNNKASDRLEDYDENVLANSSNIAPPGEITLPQVEANNYSSFDEITKNLERSNNSYEESLSAENDVDNTPLNFISIWHSQERQKKPYNTHTNNHISTLTYDVNKPSENDSNKVKFPSSLQPKKFKEVNVMSRRVVSPGFEDLHVSGFLPELSEDSGFGSQLKLFKSGYNTSGMSNYSQVLESNGQKYAPLNTRNVLSNLDNNPNVVEPPKVGNNWNKNLLKQGFKISRSLKPEANASRSLKPEDSHTQTKQSKFRVPSFEIKRTNSTLSPRNQYDEIFEDVIKQPPTIKSHGMKTLPSMDRDDVKRILATKRVISQDEYSKVKLIGNSKKNSIVNEPNDKYDDLQQHASICNVSTESSPVLDKNVLPHLANELLRIPSALLSKDQLFNEFGFPPKTSDNIFNNSQSPSRTTSVIHNKESAAPLEDYVTSKPLPSAMDIDQVQKLEQSPETNMSPIDNDVSLAKAYQTTATPESMSPKKRMSPIKIGSPVKLVKKDSGINKSFSSPSKTDDKENEDGSFAEQELVNIKLRDSPKKSETKNPKHDYKPSTVSVPSFYSNDTSSTKPLSMVNKDYHTAWQQQKQQKQQEQQEQEQLHAEPQLDVKDPLPGLQERGRLFLRVIGLKNIDLPDINDHHADFSITLDNGVHCIKTSNYKMDSHNTLINKEFELTVGNSLEFILTMKASYEKSRGKLVEVKERRVVKSKNRISRLFGSKDIITTTKFVPQDMKDNWSNKVAQDGSFARCYVDLDQYESKITGEACNFNITCFNEWETIPGKDNGPRTRCQPYRIGQLEVKMLFVPRTNNQEILPTSIKSAYECIEDLNQESNLTHEGYLHQEGGDCEILKKRYFKLQGTSLVAHSEFSHKTRAKINLSKIVDVIYVDETDINKSSANYRNFSDVILVPHSFKIRFANGEVIDFGAPNRNEKLAWVAILEKIVYRNKFRRQPWVKLMIEEANAKKEPNERSRTKKIF
ncbi:uncharacterized protein AC631_01801 [Debaryomyces fabryi]|uniref:PH domain-containing protein n=1 Tax=Debaryomyces fabryi TaxID=58627 RepID=A0A0V1Q1S9_9ASCO|nr:uncharacterized protein AC631_01801 [Debaryomyces fabryi]KSA02432.1 hypothetical protein AC631_01801 [Debaryomyces fabryi]